ncbi:MAG: hypothetical protein MPK62_00650 [Alphaproteobacteria bacterium]|nr:hypothetical protein [Alphaproteobacteria bacterium]MDA8029647.1 hypothetical protein [Alphaproteobacteria bacterium]
MIARSIPADPVIIRDTIIEFVGHFVPDASDPVVVNLGEYHATVEAGLPDTIGHGVLDAVRTQPVFVRGDISIVDGRHRLHVLLDYSRLAGEEGARIPCPRLARAVMRQALRDGTRFLSLGPSVDGTFYVLCMGTREGHYYETGGYSMHMLAERMERSGRG